MIDDTQTILPITMETEIQLSQARETSRLYLEKGAGRTVSTQRYDDTASDYDRVTAVLGYKGPAKMAAIMADLFPDNRNKIRVLDVVAGTGQSGEEMLKEGFTQIDAVDPSQGMLDVAKERNVYGRLICDYVDNEHRLDVPDNCYDAVTICGGMGNNHLPPGAFDEIIRVVKPGGVILNMTRMYVFTGMDDYIDVLDPYFRKLESSGKWVEESRSTCPGYMNGLDGITFIHRIPA